MNDQTKHDGQPVNQQLLAALHGVVDDIQGLIAESDGVAGLHRNGDVAPWHELEAGGRYERLSHLPAAIEALQRSEGGRKWSEQCAEHGALTDEGTKQAAQPLPSGPVMHMPSGVAFDEVIAAANPGDLVALTPQSAAEAAQPVGDKTWFDGYPPFPQDQEWFIAITTYGDRVVLRALDKDYSSYQYTTADHTYIKKESIAHWMQFPDCEYLPPKTPQPASAHPVAVPATRELTDDELWAIRNHVAINEVTRDDDSRTICIKQGRAVIRAMLSASQKGGAA